MPDLKRLVGALVPPRSGGLAAGVLVGGLALIGGLAYRAAARGGSGRAGAAAPRDLRDLDLDDDDTETVLLAMIAASVADGLIDNQERKRLDDALASAELGLDERRWLDRQLSDPPRVDEIAERVETPELAVHVYTAARLCVDPDTLQERQFLKDLAAALDVPGEAVERLEAELAA